MDTKHWTKIETICEQALNLSQPDRTAFIERACAGDDALRSEILSLLDQFEKDPEVLNRTLVSFSPSGFFPGREFSSTYIGPYRLIRTIAAGGMGEVYLAVRDDDVFNRYVAIKVIRRGLSTDDVLNRFYAERQILASLNHPNIARLFDGGATDEGLPWFAMEYIEGVSIIEYCNQHKLTVRERLHLFLDVCSAVQYAHQNLIVHRDLKPGNILVTPDGKPKLLDFGIAKILEQDNREKQTLIQNRIMTPEYASPEQIRNEPVSTVSDVYSLGVLLYELLTRRLPYKLESSPPGDIEKVICEQEPLPPSLLVRNEGLSAKGLTGDLDNIIMIALKKDPGQRYSSVEQFAEDIRRHLSNEPVIARPDSIWYRGRKFVTRHAWSVGFATTILVLVIAFSVITMIQSSAIKQSALQVKQERDRAEQISGFLIDLFESADPYETRDASITAQELIRRGAERAETELSNQPELQSKLFLVISDVYERLGLYTDAENAIQNALTIRTELFGPHHPDVAEALNSLGWISFQQGNLSTADSLLYNALIMRRELLGSQHLDVARTLNDLAVVKQARADYTATDSLLREALNIRRKVLGDGPEAVGITLSNYAALKWQLGDLDEAERLMRQSLSIFQTQRGKEDLRTATAMNNLAALLVTKNEYDDAEKLYRETLAIRHKLVGEEHPDVAYSLAHLGNLLRYKGEYEEAQHLLEKALKIRQTLLGNDHILIGDSKRTLALLYDQIGEYKLAEEYFLEAKSVFREILPEGHTRTAEILHLLGDLYVRTEQMQSAKPLLREALKIRMNHFGMNDARTIETKILLGLTEKEIFESK